MATLSMSSVTIVGWLDCLPQKRNEEKRKNGISKHSAVMDIINLPILSRRVSTSSRGLTLWPNLIETRTT